MNLKGKKKYLLATLAGTALIVSATACSSAGGAPSVQTGVSASDLVASFQQEGLTNVRVVSDQVFSTTPDNFNWICYMNNGNSPDSSAAIVNVDNWTCYTPYVARDDQGDPDVFAHLTGGTIVDY